MTSTRTHSQYWKIYYDEDDADVGALLIQWFIKKQIQSNSIQFNTIQSQCLYIFQEQRERVRKTSGYFMHNSNDGRRGDREKKQNTTFLLVRECNDFVLFVLVQSVTYSFIYIWRSLFVFVRVCALCFIHYVRCVWYFYYDLLSKIFRILFIMRCSLSGYQFWSKEFIELALHPRPTCSDGTKKESVCMECLTRIFIHGKLKFKANRTDSENPPNFLHKNCTKFIHYTISHLTHTHIEMR